jgi:hypothetical protein
MLHEHIDVPENTSVSSNAHFEAFERPISPLDLPPGQIDGLESIQAARMMDVGGQSPRSESGGLQLQSPGRPSIVELALVAMQYLPMPLIVLNSKKTALFANEAVGRLLGLDDMEYDYNGSENGISATDILVGKTLSQIGIDMMQDGRLVNFPSSRLYMSPIDHFCKLRLSQMF